MSKLEMIIMVSLTIMVLMVILGPLVWAGIKHVRYWYIWNWDCSGVECSKCPCEERCDDEN